MADATPCKNHKMVVTVPKKGRSDETFFVSSGVTLWNMQRLLTRRCVFFSITFNVKMIFVPDNGKTLICFLSDKKPQ